MRARGPSRTPLTRRPRFSLAMTYDAADRFVLLFGGWSAVQTSSFGDTWTFAGGAWIELFPAPSPSPRNYQVLTYDAALNAAVLTGGHVGSNVYNDTWAYNASDGWPLFATPSAPSPRWAQDLAYDPSSELVWQFGGFALSGSYQSDTWAFGSTLELSAHSAPTTGAAGSPVSFTAWVTGGLPPVLVRMDLWRWVSFLGRRQCESHVPRSGQLHGQRVGIHGSSALRPMTASGSRSFPRSRSRSARICRPSRWARA